MEEYKIAVVISSGRAVISLLRYLSPLTSERIAMSLPLEGIVVNAGNAIYISLDIEGTLEGVTNQLKAGEVGMNVERKMMIIALRNIKLDFRATRLGIVREGLEVISAAKTGEKARIERI
ncbi:MAG: hypothetical protein ACUX7D_04940 [Candidatus Methanodesulfokora washburnensis]|jgi:hypothetical protein|nr:MAG: hypothetical protein EF810_02675 [Candidatus Methanodesulfokores washburnensis]